MSGSVRPAALLEPLRLGPAELPNRVVSTSHQTSLVERHLPTEDLCAYHAARASGGVGAIFLEATAVHPTGILTPHTLGGYLPGIVAGYERLAAVVRPHGTRLLVQLFHGGREQFGDPPRAPAVAPSAVPSPRFASEPRALTATEIDEIVAGYAAAAAHARDGGLDGVEVSMAHGYLAAQFFSPRSNRRDDAYAGDFDARLRFGVEVLEAIRSTVGREIAVGVRLAAHELDPDGDGREQCARIAARVAASGLVDFVSLALGHSASYRASTWIAPPSPATPNAIVAELPPPGTLGEVPVIAATRIVDLDDAERIVASGAAHAVGMTRALIADPELVRKAASGRAAAVIPCIGCNQACIGHYHLGVPIGCVVNPRTGRERRLPPLRRSARRVLVAGGGPAGITAAVQAARAGDAVTLLERAEELGGQLRLAGGAPAHAEVWRRFAAMARRDLEEAGVDVRLGVEAAAADADGHDAVVVATGAEPYAPPLAPLGGVRVLQAWDAIARPEAVPGPVLVADWGGEWSGLDAAEVLAARGTIVTLACAALSPGATLHQYQRNGYLDRLDRAGVTILHHHELAMAEGQTILRHVFSGRPSAIGDVAILVLAQGRRPQDALWRALEHRPGITRVGDVLGPRTAEEAVLEGFMAGRAAVPS